MHIIKINEYFKSSASYMANYNIRWFLINKQDLIININAY